MTVRELNRKIQQKEIHEWRAYETITGPLGPERIDIQFAHLRHTIAMSVWSGKGKGPQLKDYFIEWDIDSREPVTDDGRPLEQWEKDKAAFSAFASMWSDSEKGGSVNGRNRQHASPSRNGSKRI
jgi:hypothetical protein